MIQSLKSFFTSPFAGGDRSITQWILIVGLVIVAVLLWSRVIGLIESTTKAL